MGDGHLLRKFRGEFLVVEHFLVDRGRRSIDRGVEAGPIRVRIELLRLLERLEPSSCFQSDTQETLDEPGVHATAPYKRKCIKDDDRRLWRPKGTICDVELDLGKLTQKIRSQDVDVVRVERIGQTSRLPSAAIPAAEIR